MYVRNEKCRVRVEEGGGFVMLPNYPEPCVANSSAVDILLFLDLPRSKDAIIEHLSTLYERKEIEQNVDSINKFIDEATRDDYLVCVEG